MRKKLLAIFINFRSQVELFKVQTVLQSQLKNNNKIIFINFRSHVELFRNRNFVGLQFG